MHYISPLLFENELGLCFNVQAVFLAVRFSCFKHKTSLAGANPYDLQFAYFWHFHKISQIRQGTSFQRLTVYLSWTCLYMMDFISSLDGWNILLVFVLCNWKPLNIVRRTRVFSSILMIRIYPPGIPSCMIAINCFVLGGFNIFFWTD